MKIYTTILFSLIIKIACSQFLSSSLHDVFSDNAYKPHSSLNVFSSDTLKSLVLNKGKLVEFAPLLVLTLCVVQNWRIIRHWDTIYKQVKTKNFLRIFLYCLKLRLSKFCRRKIRHVKCFPVFW